MDCFKPVAKAVQDVTNAVTGAVTGAAGAVTNVMGGGKRRTHTRKSMKKGGGVISTAIVPFGLLGLQRLMKSRKSNKHHKRSKHANKTRRY